MKVSYQLTALTVFLLLCQLLLAQKKMVPGYYISPQLDTVKGVFPDYVQWGKNPADVSFMAAGTGGVIRLTQQNVRLFVVEGYDEYRSYTGPRLLNPIDDYVLLSKRNLIGFNDSLQHVTTFLRLVTRTPGGDLYVLTDAARTNFFFQAPGGPLIELRYKKVFARDQIEEVANYKQQLNNLFTEAIRQRGITSRLERLPYSEEGLSSFLQDLFYTAKPEGRKKSGGTEWIFSAGGVLNRVNVQADRSVISIPQTYGSSFSPLLSLGFRVPLSRNFGKYFFYPQMKFFRYKNTGEEVQDRFINQATYQADLVAAAVFSSGVNVINKAACRVFVAGGAGLAAQFGARQVRQLYMASDHSPYNSATRTELPTLTYVLEASAGVRLGEKMLLQATYMVPAQIGNFLFYTPRLSGVQVSVGYKL